MNGRHLTMKRGALAALLLGVCLTAPISASEVESFIVQGDSLQAVASAVESVVGTVTHELGIIRAVAAELTAAERLALARTVGVHRIWDDGTAELTGRPSQGQRGGVGGGLMAETYYPTHLGADLLHAEGIDGTGVTIAVIDSSIFEDNGLTLNARGNNECCASTTLPPAGRHEEASLRITTLTDLVTART